MPRELTYRVSFERLTKLSRSATRKTYRTFLWANWLLFALALMAVFSLYRHGEAMSRWLAEAGIPAGLELMYLAVALVVVVGSRLLGKLRIGQIKERANFDQDIRLTGDDGGLRFVTDEIEHYLKWQGINQMLIEPDGVVLAHSSLFFFVPDAAFASAGERQDFIRDVYGRLSDDARALSEPHLRAALDAGTGAAA